MESREAATEIVARLRAAGHLAYFVGGCVRDLLLGLQPKDFDVATSARPEQVLAMFEKTLAVGRALRRGAGLERRAKCHRGGHLSQ